MRVKQIAGPNQTKACPICGRDLPLEAYSKGTGIYGRRSICKECDRNLHNTPEARERRRLRRIERRNTVAGLREKEKQTDLLRLQNNEDAYKKYIIRSAKRRALSQGIPFDIDYTDIHIPEYCPLLGIKLNKHIGDGGRFDDSPSLDKIIPELGYVKGNVWIISDRANRIKSDASLEELQLLVKNLENHWVH
jgi:hypothetical protein|nr:MAG TPA: restriction endonuclease [Caudoviricetes sp.]